MGRPAPRLSQTSFRFKLTVSAVAGIALGGLLLDDFGLNTSAGGVQAAAIQTEDDLVPERHFRVERPAELTGADALTIYERILDDMIAGYRLSALPQAESYRHWRRYNSYPYRSAQHGERYVNNYANPVAKAYGDFEDSGPLPVGSVLVKDSFTVTARGDVFSGPLFVMEKMPAGFSPRRRDWRYVMIMPDGSLFGMTGGEGDARVDFCSDCHALAGDGQDHLFHVPQNFRIRFLE